MSNIKINKNSTFWDSSINEYDVDEFLGRNNIDKPKGKDIVALAGYKRAISNFVNIITGKNIPVQFIDANSYTDGKTVTIGSNLNDRNFDVAVGLALHEGSHVLLSDFKLLKNLKWDIPDELYLDGNSKNVLKDGVVKLTKNILNYIEDRRIDNFIFSTSPGYKGYYHSMYDKYFYSKIVDKGLLSSEARDETIESYLFRIINLHNKNTQLKALKGLSEIYKLINLRNISKLTSTKEVLKVALDVVKVILNNIDKIKIEDSENDDDNETKNGDSGSDSSTDDETESTDANVENDETALNDNGSEVNDLSDNQKKQLQKQIDKQEDFLEGDVKKSKLSKKDNEQITALDKSNTTYEEVGKDYQRNSWSKATKGIKCLVIKKLTQSLIDSDMFGCSQSSNQKYYSRRYNFVEEGLRLGTMLGRKLKIRGEETSLKYNRKDNGKIDKRMLAELGFGNSNIFSQTFVEKYNKAYLHISIDASGSMDGTKWNKAMTSAVAMIKACDMAGNIDVVVSIRSTYGRYKGSSNVPLIMIVFDSRTDKLSKVRNLFQSLDCSGTTPEGLCYEAIMNDLIPGTSNQDSYFVNYSDGSPMYSNNEIYYTGNSAINHTKKMVDKMRKIGLKVIGYYITNDTTSINHWKLMEQQDFKTMYGNDSVFIEPTNMMEVAKSMNKRFLSHK